MSLFGIIFQIRDDYMSLCSPEFTQKKELYEDIREGKFSFPIIHGLHADPHNHELLNNLRAKTNDENVKRYAVAYIERTGSFAHCRQVLETLVGRARQLVDAIDAGRGEKDAIMGMLERMVVHVVS